MFLIRTVAVLAMVLSLCARGQDDPWVVPMDVVSLLDRGEHELGLDSLSVQHPPFTYRFANEASAAVFRADPARYAIRLGGACARMGILSPHGDPSRYLIREGGVYIFASDSCRDTFEKHADRLLWVDDPRPVDDADAEAEGREWLVKATEAHGGAALREAASYAHVTRTDREYQGALHVQQDVLRVSFATSSVRSEYAWDDSWWVTRCESGRAFQSGPEQPELELDPIQARGLAHAARRTLIGALRAADDPAAEVRDAGTASCGSTEARLVDVWLDGLTTTLVIDPASSRVLALRARDHGGRSLFIAPVERRFSNWATQAGVVLPTAVTTVYDGDEASAKTTVFDEVAVTPAG